VNDREITGLIWKKFEYTNDFVATHNRLMRKQELKRQEDQLKAEEDAETALHQESLAHIQNKKTCVKVAKKTGRTQSINLYDPTVMENDYKNYPTERSRIQSQQGSQTTYPLPSSSHIKPLTGPPVFPKPDMESYEDMMKRMNLKTTEPSPPPSVNELAMSE